MQPDDRVKVKQEIESRMKATKASMESLKELSKPVAPDSAIGRITRMDAIQQKNMNQANLRSAEQTFLRLEEALLKMNEPTFGMCECCNKPIPFERMLILPESTRCVGCVGRFF